LIFLLLLMFAAIVFLHFSKHGRYLFAIGSNEQAARYSGIATDAYKILAYVLCSTLVAVYSILYVAKFGQSTPSSEGSFKELYAIAGAVLGGCSLRGGEGNVVGMLIGTCIIIILPNLVTMWGFSSQLEFFIIGAALFLGAVLDELMRRRNTVRR
jgi:ribose transport system permease protein